MRAAELALQLCELIECRRCGHGLRKKRGRNDAGSRSGGDSGDCCKRVRDDACKSVHRTRPPIL